MCGASFDESKINAELTRYLDESEEDGGLPQNFNDGNFQLSAITRCEGVKVSLELRIPTWETAETLRAKPLSIDYMDTIGLSIDAHGVFVSDDMDTIGLSIDAHGVFVSDDTVTKTLTFDAHRVLTIVVSNRSHDPAKLPSRPEAWAYLRGVARIIEGGLLGSD